MWSPYSLLFILASAAASKVYHKHPTNKCLYYQEMDCPGGTKWRQDKKRCEDLEARQTCPINNSKKSKKIFIDISISKAPTYDQADKVCKSVCANLPVPASEEESQYLKHLTKKYYWLGISDRWAEGVWRVAHGGYAGPIINYTNWYGTEPNGGTKGQCAFARHDGYWFDTICHTKQSAVICEMYIA